MQTDLTLSTSFFHPNYDANLCQINDFFCLILVLLVHTSYFFYFLFFLEMWITNDTLREKYSCFFTKYTLGWQRSILLLFADLFCCCWFYRDIWNLFLWEFWIHIAIMSRKYGLFCCDQIKSKCILYDAYFPQEFSRLANKNCNVTNSMVELIKQITSQFKITPLFFIFFLFF